MPARAAPHWASFKNLELESYVERRLNVILRSEGTEESLLLKTSTRSFASLRMTKRLLGSIGRSLNLELFLNDDHGKSIS